MLAGDDVAVVGQLGFVWGCDPDDPEKRTLYVRLMCVQDTTATSSRPDPLRRHLTWLLGKYNGCVSSIARDLGKDRTQVRRWLRRYQLDAAQYRKAA